MKAFGFIFLGLILLSCSKQTRVGKKIVDNWSISTSHMVKYEYDTERDYPLDYSGNIIFYEDLTGSFTSDSLEMPFPENFTWSNIDNTLIIKDINSKLSYEFEIDEFTKSRMYIHRNSRQNELTFGYDSYRIYMVLLRL